MKKTNKKGFTIVELVIVIVVIAILAAVLIPTFVSLVRKANISNDTMLVKNLNTALAAGTIADEPEDFDDVVEILTEGGFIIANLNPSADDCYFVWESSTNQILLVDAKEEYAVIYSAKEEYKEVGDTWYFAINNLEEKKAVEEDLADKGVNFRAVVADTKALSDVLNADGENVVYVDDSFVIDEESVFCMDNADADVTIKLGTSVVSGRNDDTFSVSNIPFVVKSGNLTIEGGTISAVGSILDADGEPANTAIEAQSGQLDLNNVTVECPDGEIVVAYTGAKGTISNSTVTAGGQAIGVFGGSSVVIENCTVNTNYEAVFVSNSGGVSSATIKGGKYHAGGNTIVEHGANVVIEDGEFSSTNDNLFKLYSSNGSITIKGGTFSNDKYSNVTFDELTPEILMDMVATTGTNYAGTTVTENEDGSFTIAN